MNIFLFYFSRHPKKEKTATATKWQRRRKMTEVITLGTAGGPRWWPPMRANSRFGISTAIVVGDRHYLVDTGNGTGRQYTRAGLNITKLRGIFITHLHSDHVTDLGNFALFGMFGLNPDNPPIPIIGPGDRGVLPPISPRAKTPPKPVAPELPTPGTKDLFRLLMNAHATDLNDRVLDALRPSPFDLFDARDIHIPRHTNFHPNDNPTPAMEPFVIFEDDRVQVQAILVEHPPIAPAFAYRFNTEEGAIVISGDTTRTANTVRIAAGADLLLHEAIDFDWVNETYGARTDETSKASIDHHRKSHTSVKEAIQIAQKAEVRQLALHHLVPGHLATERWLAEAGAHALVPEDLTALPLNAKPYSLA